MSKASDVWLSMATDSCPGGHGLPLAAIAATDRSAGEHE